MKKLNIIRRTKKTVFIKENKTITRRRIEKDVKGKEYIVHNGKIYKV